MNIRTIFFAAILLLTSSSLFSQGLAVGIKGGANLGKISGHTFKDEFALSYHIGAFATIGGEKWAIQPEVYSARSMQTLLQDLAMYMLLIKSAKLN